MHKNPVWLGFLSLIFIITCYFAAIAVMDVYHYRSLEQETTATVNKWSIVQVSSQHYSPKAEYTFQVGDNSYSGETLFTFRVHRNSASAQDDVKRMARKNWTVSYNPSNPTQSVLAKQFPLWSCLSGGFMFAILIYFIWLGFYVGQRTIDTIDK